MWFYLLAAGLLLHTCFWGAGLALLATPRLWRRFWWVFVPAFGLALQSAVVWVGAHTSLAGTRVYAWPSELLPLLLLGAAAWRFRASWGQRLGDWRRAAGVGVVVLAAGWTLLSPMGVASRGLTSLSLGSCDHADYAAGARVLQEFSRDDRTGFLGLSEVTRVRSAEYFFDFWLRMNHFTPSALVAHHGVVLDARPDEMISVLAVVLVLLNVPPMFFLARRLLGLRDRPLLVLTAVYAFSPLQSYAVQAGALGQLLATQGIALLTLVAFAAVETRRAWAFAPLALGGFWILAGSYNFILTVCLAPAGAGLIGWIWLRRDWRGPVRVLAMLAATLALCATLFWGRFDGLIERFGLFEQYDFGWPVPLLSPEGWLGLVSDPALHAWPAILRVALSVAAVTGWFGGMAWLWRRRRKKQALAALALTLPVIAGWAVLAWESRTRANASYDAYKLIAVFYPGLLAGLAGWLGAARLGSLAGQRVAGLCAAAVLAGNLLIAGEARREMMHAPLRVTRQLREVGQLESNPRVASLNLRVEDFWSRLWANAFLLKKPQYFATHTYEGRLDTPLRGEWDLRDTPLRTWPFSAEDFITVNSRFDAVRVGAAGRVEAEFAKGGWLPEENDGNEHWRWMTDRGRVWVRNNTGGRVVAALRLRVVGVTPRTLRLARDGVVLLEAKLGSVVQEVVLPELDLPPGVSPIDFESVEPPVVPPGGNDPRKLSVALYGFELRARRFR